MLSRLGVDSLFERVLGAETRPGIMLGEQSRAAFPTLRKNRGHHQPLKRRQSSGVSQQSKMDRRRALLVGGRFAAHREDSTGAEPPKKKREELGQATLAELPGETLRVLRADLLFEPAAILTLRD